MILRCPARRRLRDVTGNHHGRGPTTIEDYLATRIVELVVRTDDLNRSLPEAAPAELHRSALSRCTRTLAGILAGQHPGRSVEVRVPPYAAIQCAITDPGPTHTRGTPPNVVETDPLTFLRLATGRITWVDAVANGTCPRFRDCGPTSPRPPLALLTNTDLSVSEDREERVSPIGVTCRRYSSNSARLFRRKKSKRLLLSGRSRRSNTAMVVHVLAQFALLVRPCASASASA